MVIQTTNRPIVRALLPKTGKGVRTVKGAR